MISGGGSSSRPKQYAKRAHTNSASNTAELTDRKNRNNNVWIPQRRNAKAPITKTAATDGKWKDHLSARTKKR